MKNLISIFLFTLIFNQAFTQEVSQCDIGVDPSNTHLVKSSNNIYKLKTIIHHPNRGNDDDANNVHINITIPVSAERVQNARVSMNDVEINSGEWQGQYFLVTIEKLSRNDFVEIELSFKFTCNLNNDQVTVSVWSEFPNDIDGSNNSLIKLLACERSTVSIIPTFPFPELPRQRPFPIDEICKYVLDCPGCGMNYLCAGDIWRVQDDPRFNGFEILEGKKVIAKSKSLGEKGCEIILPKFVNGKKYFVSFF